MTAPIVGLLGKKQAGKDTVAARLVAVHGYRRFAFADAVKEVMYELDPLVPVVNNSHRREHMRLSTYVNAHGWDYAKANPEVRRLLQHHGTAARRVLGEDVWVDIVMRQVDALRGGVPAVVTDVRFPNELGAIWARGGRTVRVVRPGTDDGDTHVSEALADQELGDYVLLNNGDLAHLHATVDHWLVSRLAS